MVVPTRIESSRDLQSRPVFRRRPVLAADSADGERVSLEMIYRNQIEFAVGHGASVHATPSSEIADKATEIRTEILPEHEVPITETPGSIDTDRPAMKKMVSEGLLEMTRLSEIGRDDLIAALSILVDDYALWIDRQKSRIGTEAVGFDGVAADRRIQMLVRPGEAQRRASMSSKRTTWPWKPSVSPTEPWPPNGSVVSIPLLRRRGDTPDIDQIDTPKNRTWRPFQLAFVLLSIPALTDPLHKDRTEPWEAYADLLWFPTGGGKTEAYSRRGRLHHGRAAPTGGSRRVRRQPRAVRNHAIHSYDC
jgi:hypothetical protein